MKGPSCGLGTVGVERSGHEHELRPSALLNSCDDQCGQGDDSREWCDCWRCGGGGVCRAVVQGECAIEVWTPCGRDPTRGGWAP